MPLEFNVACTKKVCVLQKKVLPFGPNHTIEVWPNSSVKLNVRSVTSLMIHVNLPIEARRCFSWFGFFRSAKQAKIYLKVWTLCLPMLEGNLRMVTNEIRTIWNAKVCDTWKLANWEVGWRMINYFVSKLAIFDPPPPPLSHFFTL